jgi:23S rRNA pseudouridine2605 synthase/23S rRNA pseudouridine2604 synthase
MEIRLNKYLANKQIASRREADKLITQGAVKVNGQTHRILGSKINPDLDQVTVDQHILDTKKQEIIVIALNKPTDYVTSTKKTTIEKQIVFDLLPKDFPRLFPVGRLDKQSTGLLLLTNDGDLTFRLTHPRFAHRKEYLVTLNKPIGNTALEKLRSGLTLFQTKTLPPKIIKLSPIKYRIILKEGKNRQIRRLFRKVGSGVQELQRVAIENLRLEDLRIKKGQWRKLSKEEIEKLG